MVKPYQPPVAPQGLVNVTDHDSRVVRTHGQPPLQGYNAQLAVNDQQLVIAAEITTESPDFGHLEPMVRATQRELRAIELGDPDVVLADAGYWHQRQIEAVVSDGMQVLVPPDAGLRKGARPGWTGGLYDFMRRVLATPDGRDLYRQRQITIEPVFGQIKFNRAIKRFQRRGRTACRSEWRLIAATHNLLKLHHHRLAAAPPERAAAPSPPRSHRPPDRHERNAAAGFPDSLASSRQRRRASFLRSRAHVVPMHRMQRLRPSGTSAGRPLRARDQRSGWLPLAETVQAPRARLWRFAGRGRLWSRDLH